MVFHVFYYDISLKKYKSIFIKDEVLDLYSKKGKTNKHTKFYSKPKIVLTISQVINHVIFIQILFKSNWSNKQY